MTKPISGAVFLEDRGVIRVSGPEAFDFLQGLISNDMQKVTHERTVYAALLTPQGKFLFDFFISKLDDSYLLETRAETIAELLKKLKLYKLRADVTLEDRSGDYSVIAILGDLPEAANSLHGAERGTASALEDGLGYIDPRLAAMGLRLIVNQDRAENTIKSWGIDVLTGDAYTLHRLGLGVPEGGIDILPEKAFLLESNFDEMDGVDHQKGCYIGQETTSRTKRRGSVRRRILPVTFDGPAEPSGTMITAGDAEIGSILSNTASHALASIRLDRWQKAKDAGETIKAKDSSISIEVPYWIEIE